jgi:hypothetical protein
MAAEKGILIRNQKAVDAQLVRHLGGEEFGRLIHVPNHRIHRIWKAITKNVIAQKNRHHHRNYL